ncbi:GWxTD domain-containing protein [Algoriphagus boseongensis]|uniref:GWxTD domain-containing protein n=1 Tax=Algoriphagus boseongensis TaxID=1442587 RepID=A0A4R6T8C3_9BACT|nr:GWxTD domain-containing protein [Algoriphagus boseongensis]TDQ18459.1 GWxTD domain-containing protein [Algoriphagus boseongensis]
MNHKSPLRIIILSFFSLLSISTFGQKSLSETDQALRYSLYSRLGLKIIPVKVSDSQYKLQLVVEKIEEKPEFNAYSFSFAVLNSYDEQITSDKINLLTSADLKADTERHWYFEKTVDIPSSQTTAIAYLSALDTRQGDEYVYHIDLKSKFVEEVPNFGAYFANEVAFDQTFINTNESLLFKSSGGPSIQSFFYPMVFDVPFPPMETRPADVPKELSVVNEGDFLSNLPKKFEKEGYYFFQTDTTAASGLLLKSSHEAFPKVKDWDEMVQMVTYISTRKEHETLLLAEDKKRALDQYWINLTRSPELAQQLIRNYFKMVEFANILFTDFKEGWKTDRGMVYIVMGPPQEVNFFEDREVWSYAGMDASSKIKFTFVRAKTILTPHFYTLNRSRAYQPIWFKNISQWRSGRMAF